METFATAHGPENHMICLPEVNLVVAEPNLVLLVLNLLPGFDLFKFLTSIFGLSERWG